MGKVVDYAYLRMPRPPGETSGNTLGLRNLVRLIELDYKPTSAVRSHRFVLNAFKSIIAECVPQKVLTRRISSSTRSTSSRPAPLRPRPPRPDCPQDPGNTREGERRKKLLETKSQLHRTVLAEALGNTMPAVRKLSCGQEAILKPGCHLAINHVHRNPLLTKGS